MRRSLVLLLVCVAAQRVVAQVDVISPRPDSVTLTVYRQGVAQITETRQIDLPAGPVNLVFEGVVDTLLPQSAVINGADRPLVETNFDFDQLSPASLLERSVGREVVIVRTNRRTGAVVRKAATIVSATADDGVVIRTTEGNEALKCSGLPERLEFNNIPDNLRTTPTLSVRLAAGAPGKRSVTVSYLVHGIAWSADYVARLNAKSNRMDLTGWVTLTNDTSVSFDRARVQLVSGELELQYGQEGGSRPTSGRRPSGPGDEDFEDDIEEPADPEPRLPLDKCVAMAEPGVAVVEADAAAFSDEDDLEEVMVTGTRIQRENLGDYKLYRLPEPTDLKSRQTKQVLFQRNPRVKVERVYLLETQDFNPYEDDDAYLNGGPRVALKWHNIGSAGLGEPLPGGIVRVFERSRDAEVFAGEAKISDKPVGLDVEVVYAGAMGVTAVPSRDPSPIEFDSSVRTLSVRVEHRLINEKKVPVTVVVQHVPVWQAAAPKIISSSVRAVSAEGNPSWRIRIPAGSKRILSYELKADNPRYGY